MSKYIAAGCKNVTGEQSTSIFLRVGGVGLPGRGLAILLALMVSTPTWAVSHGDMTGPASSARDEAVSIQPAGRQGAVERRQSGARSAGDAGTAAAGRVYLDDYQLLPQTVTKPRPTRMVWLGQKNKTR
jgi:hypothetical protein